MNKPTNLNRKGWKEWYNNTYLLSDHWIDLRNSLIAKVNYKCEKCGSSPKTLNCHHLSYANLGKELRKDLIIVCKDCHLSYHPEKIKEMNSNKKKKKYNKKEYQKKYYQKNKKTPEEREEINKKNKILREKKENLEKERWLNTLTINQKRDLEESEKIYKENENEVKNK